MKLSADAQAALEMALNSKLWFSGPRMKVQVSELMCQFANQKSDGIRKAYEMVDAENAELRLQVSALTQVLETQNRENQPYIKELEEIVKNGLQVFQDIVHQDEFRLEGICEQTINEAKLLIYLIKKATGGDKPEQEQ